ncbi:unnamed protein product [Hyaloperonospora brassicae]|uniref:PX domain-containing protein n=1 Tax=Hyaloperonospora brassicae TaxID=162125 RepID=A0AAV0TVJ7_HYABA|nr:unnamed protein product [Hyaloperonospora brassicae]
MGCSHSTSAAAAATDDVEAVHSPTAIGVRESVHPSTVETPVPERGNGSKDEAPVKSTDDDALPVAAAVPLGAVAEEADVDAAKETVEPEAVAATVAEEEPLQAEEAAAATVVPDEEAIEAEGVAAEAKAVEKGIETKELVCVRAPEEVIEAEEVADVAVAAVEEAVKTEEGVAAAAVEERVEIEEAAPAAVEEESVKAKEVVTADAVEESVEAKEVVTADAVEESVEAKEVVAAERVEGSTTTEEVAAAAAAFAVEEVAKTEAVVSTEATAQSVETEEAVPVIARAESVETEDARAAEAVVEVVEKPSEATTAALVDEAALSLNDDALAEEVPAAKAAAEETASLSNEEKQVPAGAHPDEVTGVTESVTEAEASKSAVDVPVETDAPVNARHTSEEVPTSALVHEAESAESSVLTFTAEDTTFDDNGVAFYNYTGSDASGARKDDVHVSKRYSEFKALHAQLSAKQMTDLPALPKAPFLQARNSPRMLEDRKTQFSVLLNAIAAHPAASQSEAFTAFLA